MRVASITASSAIEGVIVPDQTRAENIIAGRTRDLRTRNEQELAGYRDALDYLFQHDWRPLNVGLLLHLHRLLFAHTKAVRGSFKASDNLVDRAADGSMAVRFRPSSLTSCDATARSKRPGSADRRVGSVSPSQVARPE